MKKIIFIFFTFSGIYNGIAQNPALAFDTGTGGKKLKTNSRPDMAGRGIVKEKPVVQLFPNPAKNKVELEIKGFDPGYMQIILLSNNGKAVKEEKRLIFSGDETIVLMFSQDPGLYYLLLK